MKSDSLTVGTVKTYIKDDMSFKHLMDIPPIVAIELAKMHCSECIVGYKHFKVKDMTPENVQDTWGNKYWIIVSNEHFNLIAINKTDEIFSIYLKSIN
jgi:hypothetical protein